MIITDERYEDLIELKKTLTQEFKEVSTQALMVPKEERKLYLEKRREINQMINTIIKEMGDINS